MNDSVSHIKTFAMRVVRWIVDIRTRGDSKSGAIDGLCFDTLLGGTGDVLCDVTRSDKCYERWRLTFSKTEDVAPAFRDRTVTSDVTGYSKAALQVSFESILRSLQVVLHALPCSWIVSQQTTKSVISSPGFRGGRPTCSAESSKSFSTRVYVKSSKVGERLVVSSLGENESGEKDNEPIMRMNSMASSWSAAGSSGDSSTASIELFSVTTPVGKLTLMVSYLTGSDRNQRSGTDYGIGAGSGGQTRKSSYCGTPMGSGYAANTPIVSPTGSPSHGTAGSSPVQLSSPRVTTEQTSGVERHESSASQASKVTVELHDSQSSFIETHESPSMTESQVFEAQYYKWRSPASGRASRESEGRAKSLRQLADQGTITLSDLDAPSMWSNARSRLIASIGDSLSSALDVDLEDESTSTLPEATVASAVKDLRDLEAVHKASAAFT